MHAKNRTSEAQEMILHATLIYDTQGTAMLGASALDLRMCRIEVRPMSLTSADAHEA